MRDSTIFYRSFYEAIKELPKETQADIYNAIFEYALNFKEQELSGLSKTVFTLIKPQLDANTKRWISGTTPKSKQEASETEANDKRNGSETEANKNNNENQNDNDIITIISFLNEQSTSDFQISTATNRSLISARLKDYSVEDIKAVISLKCKEWKGKEFEKYLRPSTLFNATKFESYYNEANKKDIIAPKVSFSMPIYDSVKHLHNKDLFDMMEMNMPLTLEYFALNKERTRIIDSSSFDNFKTNYKELHDTFTRLMHVHQTPSKNLL
jgi:uncharacterized phage protein (TIGR02220 family)